MPLVALRHRSQPQRPHAEKVLPNPSKTFHPDHRISRKTLGILVLPPRRKILASKLSTCRPDAPGLPNIDSTVPKSSKTFHPDRRFSRKTLEILVFPPRRKNLATKLSTCRPNAPGLPKVDETMPKSSKTFHPNLRISRKTLNFLVIRPRRKNFAGSGRSPPHRVSVSNPISGRQAKRSGTCAVPNPRLTTTVVPRCSKTPAGCLRLTNREWRNGAPQPGTRI